MPEPFVVLPREPGFQGGLSARSPRRSAREAASRALPDAAARAPTQPPAPFVVAPGVLTPAEERGPLMSVRTSVPSSLPAAPPNSLRLPESRHPALDPLLPYLSDPDVTDLFVNGAAGLYVDRGGGAQPVPEWFATEADVRELAVTLIGLGDRHIDDANPCVDVRLEGGIRVHAVLPPVSAEGTMISVRVPRMGIADLDDLEHRGMFDRALRARLEDAVARRTNILVTGAAGAGKTTLLAALLALAPQTERIVTIEDVAELRIRHPHHIRLEARQANLEGAGAIGLARLVREALRMRPDRLVVGECRGEEVRELLGALNTGHDGGAGTLHANGLEDVPARLEALGALAGLDDHALARQVASAIGCIVHIAREPDGVRRISGAGRPVIGAGGLLAIEVLPWLGQ